MALDTLKRDNEGHKKEFERINKILEELESKSVEHDQELSTINRNLESTLLNLSLVNRKLESLPGRVIELEDKTSEHDKQIQDLLNKISLLSGTGDVDMSGLVSKSEFEELKNNIETKM